MDNPEEILHSLEEFSKLRPKDIPRELEEYLSFVAKTGDPVYQWSAIKSLFREKLINVITEFYESCPTVEIPPCPNVELFNYDSMKSFILEKLDTFTAAPFTVQRICELLTTPRKEYNRIDKYMRALEKNILVVSTTEPGNRRSTENGEGVVNGLEGEHVNETSSSNNDINVEEMDETPEWRRLQPDASSNYHSPESNKLIVEPQTSQINQSNGQETYISETRSTETVACSSVDTVVTCRSPGQQPYVSIEPVASDSCSRQDTVQESDVTVTITAIPATVQNRRNSDEPVVSSDPCLAEVSDSTQEISSDQKPEGPEAEHIEESSSTDKDCEKVDSTSVLHGLEGTDVIHKEADEILQTPSTSTESKNCDVDSENAEKSKDVEVESELEKCQETESVDPIASSEEISADTTKIRPEADENECKNIRRDLESETVTTKEEVISSSDEVVNETSSTDSESKLQTTIESSLIGDNEVVSVKSPESHVDTSENLKKEEVAESSSDSNTQLDEQTPMEVDISDDTTQDTAILAPSTDESNS